MTREILVKMDITGATDTHCWNEDIDCKQLGKCPYPPVKNSPRVRHPDCLAAEQVSKYSTAHSQSASELCDELRMRGPK